MIHAKRTLQPIYERLLVRLPRTRHGCYTACATLPSGITPVELSSSISIQSSTSAVPVVPLDTPAEDDTGCPNCMVVFSDLDWLFRSPPMNPRRLSRRREDCDGDNPQRSGTRVETLCRRAHSWRRAYRGRPPPVRSLTQTGSACGWGPAAAGHHQRLRR